MGLRIANQYPFDGKPKCNNEDRFENSYKYQFINAPGNNKRKIIN